MNYTVLTFNKILFNGVWKRSISPSGIVIYTASEGASLYVVSESPAGILETYHYAIKPSLEVWVSVPENTVHVPGCTKPVPKDTSACQ